MNNKPESDSLDINELKRHPSILNVYNSRVQLRRAGKEFKGRCPMPGHNDSDASFTVYVDQGVWIYKCHGCGVKSGNAIQFVQIIDGITFPEAMKRVEQELGKSSSDKWFRSGQQVDKVFAQPIVSDEPKKTISSTDFKPRQDALLASPEAAAYLATRGITVETAARLGIGYIKSIRPPADAADVADKGWLCFPCMDGNTVASLKYRSIARKAFARKGGMATALFNSNAIDPFGPIYVVEGELDACALEQIGLRAISLPSATSNLTPAMRDQLKGAQCVILAGDNDGKVGTRVMEQLWRELGEDAYLLIWPDGIKDANAALLKYGDAFPELVATLTAGAKSRPMAGVFNMTEVLRASTDNVAAADDPRRLRFKWRSVDDMAIIMPGSVLLVYAEVTGTGKSSWVLESTVWNARKTKDVVLNYQCELTPQAVATLMTAQLLHKDRTRLTAKDKHDAAALLGNALYYVGRDTTLTSATKVLDLIEAAIRRLGATIVVLDHIHFICRQEQDQVRAQENAMQRVTNMAAKYGIKFIIVGQPSKTNRDNRRKGAGGGRHLHNVKGSEAFTSDAHAVFLLSREPLKAADGSALADLGPLVTIERQKARDQGPGAGVTTLYFRGEHAAFTDVSKDP